MSIHVEGIEALERLARDLRRFDNNKEILKAMRRELRKPVAGARDKIKKNAIAILPRRNGLGMWISREKITSRIKLSGREVSVTLRGSRKNLGGKNSDLNRIDQGALRAPSWGRRGPGAWHTQAVRSGFFTQAVEETEWSEAIDNAVDQAVRFIDGA